jgi:hypothetical protein
LRIISSKDLPLGVSEDLNCQPHSEQPKPRKRSCSIHISFRIMARHITDATFGSSVGYPTYRKVTLIMASPEFGAHSEAELIESWLLVSGVFKAFRIAQHQDRIQRRFD